jgi:hypothetical protein
MRSSIFSGPVGGLGELSDLGSASGVRVEGCSVYLLVCGGFACGVVSVAPDLSFDGVGVLNWGTVGGLYCDNPAATAVLVCTHLKNGLECMTTLRFFLGLGRSVPTVVFAACACSSSRWCSSAAIRRPSALPCCQPP